MIIAIWITLSLLAGLVYAYRTGDPYGAIFGALLWPIWLFIEVIALPFRIAAALGDKS